MILEDCVITMISWEFGGILDDIWKKSEDSGTVIHQGDVFLNAMSLQPCPSFHHKWLVENHQQWGGLVLF